jgi:site-specific recombinase XerD
MRGRVAEAIGRQSARVQEHLRHADIQTTTVYTRLTQSDLQKIVSTVDATGK